VPAIKPAAEISRSRAIGVLGTDATIRQPYVDRLSEKFAGDCLVLRHGSARLVELAEASLRGDPGAPEEYAGAIHGLLDQPGGERIDTVVLACTHFPLVAEQLAAAAPRPLAFVHGGEGIARRIAHLTGGQDWPETVPPGVALFTGNEPVAPDLAKNLSGYGLNRIDRF
jgi:glutamate racemase